MTEKRNEGVNEEIMEDKGEIVIYQTQDGITQLDVRLDGGNCVDYAGTNGSIV